LPDDHATQLLDHLGACLGELRQQLIHAFVRHSGMLTFRMVINAYILEPVIDFGYLLV
jgi:hypothetical protein